MLGTLSKLRSEEEETIGNSVRLGEAVVTTTWMGLHSIKQWVSEQNTFFDGFCYKAEQSEDDTG